MVNLDDIPAGRTRIAPTPSGYLHVGNAFNFLLTERLARSSGSTLLLRIDDLDAERKRPEYVEDIFATLDWLGIRIDEGPSGPLDFERNWSQELRLERYRELAVQLRKRGVLYPCGCSRSVMQEQEYSGLQHTCRDVTAVKDEASVSWRLRVDQPCPVAIHDVNGIEFMVDLASEIVDPVLIQRNNGRPAYQLASLSDDVEMAVTLVARGTDLWPSSLCQLRLAEFLGLTTFRQVRFLHHPLVLDGMARKLSKSSGGIGQGSVRDSGIRPEAIRDAVDRFLENENAGVRL